ncbi:hypothetical protein EMIHUDRAFT_108739 [Emiliania huxleyi CCMP1516]|uniref:SAM domain-containing protein n=2 Tax=Emiliania huxleyi TaxID=2903 RepID=A0A0D3KW42_EMIH1|nr:hypothetical protein EMIHUDRAFT_108739 [Emiliania huxleyi CCMP1516]EOD39977.1 hypothetical protein EMIHUDRAFT_108739 [Emiliania huxleyi CCMP1516]|eukprot:XP_005792406.1 hypothetical protein EMIHUDRAFT_108739 [Emiliania huxleyi CCMP1516]
MASHRIGARVAGLSPEQLCAIIEAQAGASDAALRVADEHATRLVEQPEHGVGMESVKKQMEQLHGVGMESVKKQMEQLHGVGMESVKKQMEQLHGVGMESVKKQMEQLCKQLSLDIRRRAEGHNTLDAIRHMMFTGNPGVGKTTVSRLVARLYHQLGAPARVGVGGVSAKDSVVEVQKGDLVAGYVNQTAMKTAKKIKEARGGILFVDEAYQLTQALQRGQSDFSGEAIDEMMKVEQQFKMWGIQHLSAFFVRAGYRQLVDLIHLSKQDIMALGVTKDAEEHRKESLEMDALFVDPDSVDVKTWLEKRSLGEFAKLVARRVCKAVYLPISPHISPYLPRSLGEFAKLFERHRVDFEVLGDLTYEDLKEMGLNEVGPRRRIHRQIVQWRDDREAKKADAIRSRMQVQENKAYLESQQQNVDDRLQHLKASLGESGYVTGLRPSSG